MERLTLREATGCVLPGFENNGVNGCYDIPDAEWLEESIDRLAAIEDILGDEYDLDRLRELAEADREGRCVVLPCKLGDTVYFITGTYNSLVKPAKVEEIYIGDGSIALGVSTDFTTFTLQESEWHLTRAEAEAALAKLNSET